jgi:hypothetical protein
MRRAGATGSSEQGDRGGVESEAGEGAVGESARGGGGPGGWAWVTTSSYASLLALGTLTGSKGRCIQ